MAKCYMDFVGIRNFKANKASFTQATLQFIVRSNFIQSDTCS